MLTHLHPACWKNAVWLVSPSTIPEIFTLHSQAGSQVDGISMFRTISEASPVSSLLGMPLIVTEKVPTLGSTGDISLVDFSQYAVGMRDSITLSASIHEYFKRDLVSFRGLARVDGQPLWDGTITLKDGTETSPIVVLNAEVV